MLKDYIKAVATRIATDKRDQGIRPPSCSLKELCSEFREDAVEIMRQLHREGLFEGHLTVNKIPILILKDITE